MYAPGVSAEYIPVRWDVTGSEAWKVHDPSFPTATAIDFAGEQVPVFSGKFRVTRDITLAAEKVLRKMTNESHELIVSGIFRYQACDDRQCFPPKTLPIEWRIRVEPRDSERVLPSSAPQISLRGCERQLRGVPYWNHDSTCFGATCTWSIGRPAGAFRRGDPPGMMMSQLMRLPFLLVLPLLVQAAEPNAPATPSTADIIKALTDSEMVRRNSFPGYVGMRSYVVENSRFKVRASMKVRVAVDRNGGKKFEVLQVTGPSAVRKLVFQRMLETEAKASARAEQGGTRISAENYRFRLIETAVLNGHTCFVVEAEPKTKNPLLFRGKAWIDASSWAVVRIEGKPAQNPSFWVNSTNFVHENENVGGQWLAQRNQSETDVRLFGHTTVRIDYFDYALGEGAGQDAAAGATQ